MIVAFERVGDHRLVARLVDVQRDRHPGKSITSSSGKIGMVSGSAVCAMPLVERDSPIMTKRPQPGRVATDPPTINQELLRMRKVAMALLTFALGAGFAVLFLDGRNAQGQAQPAAPAGGFSAVAERIGTQDVTGPYEVVKGWPKDVCTLPGNEKWTVRRR